MATDIREQVTALLEPVVEAAGYELVELEFLPGSGGGILRLYIDLVTSDPAAAIGIEDCEQVSRAVAATLDESDPIPGAYSLEVSSPGFDRVLRKPAHFVRFVGERVKVELSVARAGRKRFTGALTAADESGIELEVDGVEVKIAYADVGRARVVPV